VTQAPGSWLVLALAAGLAGCATAGAPRSSLTAAEHNDLGVAYYRAGEMARAEREFAEATALDPAMVRALVNLGDVRLARGAVREALQAYDRAVLLAPEDAAAANNLAWALLQDAERWPEAEAVIRRALARDPEPRGYYLDTLGLALLRKGDAMGALAAFRAALAEGAMPDRATRAMVLAHAADAHTRLGDAAAAARCLDRARALREAAAGPLAAAPSRRVATVVGDTPGVC